MTYDMAYSWKDFRIHLPSLHEWMKSNAPKYVGISAGMSLILHFSEAPSQETKDRIQMYFDAAKEESESGKRALDEARQKAKKMAIDVIPSMLWDAMIPAERKIIMNQQLSKDDLDELVKKHIK